MWPRRSALVGLIAALALGTVLPLLGPIIIGYFVDRAADGTSTSELVEIALLYLLVAAGAQGATVVRTWVASRQAWTATNHLREEMAGHALSLDIGYHGEHPPGEMIERVDGDVHTIAEFLVTFLVDILGRRAAARRHARRPHDRGRSPRARARRLHRGLVVLPHPRPATSRSLRSRVARSTPASSPTSKSISPRRRTFGPTVPADTYCDGSTT